MSRNTTNMLESNPGHLHCIRGLPRIRVIGEWHFVKSVYAFHLWNQAYELSCWSLFDMWILSRLRYPALRVPPAETRLTVYRRLSIIQQATSVEMVPNKLIMWIFAIVAKLSLRIFLKIRELRAATFITVSIYRTSLYVKAHRDATFSTIMMLSVHGMIAAFRLQKGNSMLICGPRLLI